MSFTLSICLLIALGSITTFPAGALTLDLVFLQPGDEVPNSPFPLAAAPPPNAEQDASLAGAGSFEEVVQSAARTWENAIADEGTITLYVGWLPFNTFLDPIVATGGIPLELDGARLVTGFMGFDSDQRHWFVDPTPDQHEEYTDFQDFFHDLGGGPVNTGRLLTRPTGEAADRHDLYSAALEIIGHLLGVNPAAIPAQDPTNPPTLTITEPRPLAGTQIPTFFEPFTNIQLAIPTAATGDWIPAGQRRLIAAVDVLAIAQVHDYSAIDLEPQPLAGYRALTPTAVHQGGLTVSAGRAGGFLNRRAKPVRQGAVSWGQIKENMGD
ncbi:MAG: hypothetical protein GKR89_07770 [Candidatus Latescibacteria bacterium]|nr:hypothetical protein [Candidatus Latescibacterota bacterium]